jgi:signal transduction histidine kinase
MRDHLSSLSMEEIHKIAGNLNNSASNLFRLLENLLQWSRVKTGSIPFNPEALSLWHVVKDSTLLVVDALRAKEIELSIGFSPGLTVYADDQMLQSVIRNLVSNAMKFTPAGGKIHLMAKIAETDFIELSVSDSGIGMSPEIIDQLFRIDSKISRKGTNGEPGSGLGLLLCREFTEKMGGTIRAESETGKGSAFIVTLPLFKG